VLGRECLNDNWVRFDAALVVLGVITQWVLQPLVGEIEGIGPLMVLRTARLLRLARAVRLLVKFRELWMLVQGLVNSASTMFYTLVMLFVVLYIFSSISMELITNNTLNKGPSPDPEFAALVAVHFASLPRTMLTLMQFATLDSMNLIYIPLIEKDWTLAIYFVSLILVVSIALMNLITAVVVNSALEQAYQDKSLVQEAEKKERKKLIVKLKGIFRRLYEDDSGEVSKGEINNIDEIDRKHLETVMGIGDPAEIFDMLDVDRSGSIGIDEFCDGIWQVVTQPGSLEVKRLEKKIDALRVRLDVFATSQLDLCKTVGGLESKIPCQPAAPFRGRQSLSYEVHSVVDEEASEEMPHWAKEMMTQLAQHNSAVLSFLQEVLNGCEELVHNQRLISSPHQETFMQCGGVAGDQHPVAQCRHHSTSLDMQNFRTAGDFTSSVGAVSQPGTVTYCRRSIATNQTTEPACNWLRSNTAQCLDDGLCKPTLPPTSPPALLLTASAKSRTPRLTSETL